ncbi:MAG TPA: hypothetical protein VN716_18955 [Vicinamibacterales bacterium]|nr:hypothetical protein [Vicinamibacterales bacterium]
MTALLLFHVELHGGLSKNHVGGEVVSVRAADAYVSEEERRLFGIVRVRGDVAKLRAKYLKNGVPDAVAARAAAEHARVFEARSAKGKVRSFLLAASGPVLDRKIMDAADPKKWPARAVVLDLKRLDGRRLDHVRMNHDAMKLARAEASDAEDAATLSVLASLGEHVAAEEHDAPRKRVGALLSKVAAAAHVVGPQLAAIYDRRADAVIHASAAARRVVEAEAFASVPLPQPHDLDERTLDAITVKRA